MIRPVHVWTLDRGEVGLADVDLPLVPPAGPPIEIEIGFGKGRFLLGEAAAHPERGYLGIESALEYYRLARQRAETRGLGNVLLIRGEALYVISACLPAARAAAVHVYFPDPWPKARHHKRRLLDPATVDLVLGLLAPDGRLLFATDHAEYGEAVCEVLGSHPALLTTILRDGWPGGPRTNYEAKYVVEGRPILRLEACRVPGADLLHPSGVLRLAAGAEGP